MDAHLPPRFRALAAHRRAGRALQGLLDLRFLADRRLDRARRSRSARPLLGGDWHPLVVGGAGDPAATRRSAISSRRRGRRLRLDRHPVMSRHPVTPMDEADVRLHLAGQTEHADRPRRLRRDEGRRARTRLSRRERAEGAEIVALDVVDEQTLQEAGASIWDEGRGQAFSPSVRRASNMRWSRTGAPRPAAGARLPEPDLRPVDRFVRGLGILLSRHGVADRRRRACRLRRHSARRIQWRPIAAPGRRRSRPAPRKPWP